MQKRRPVLFIFMCGTPEKKSWDDLSSTARVRDSAGPGSRSCRTPALNERASLQSKQSTNRYLLLVGGCESEITIASRTRDTSKTTILRVLRLVYAKPQRRGDQGSARWRGTTMCSMRRATSEFSNSCDQVTTVPFADESRTTVRRYFGSESCRTTTFRGNSISSNTHSFG